MKIPRTSIVALLLLEAPTICAGQDPLVSTHWIACGHSDDRCGADSTVEAGNNEQHEVRCCANSNLSTFPTPKRNPGCDVWAESNIGGSCFHSKTYDQAKRTCEDAGARLCTLQEIEDGCADNSGCQHDHDQVWSSTANSCYGTFDTSNVLAYDGGSGPDGGNGFTFESNSGDGTTYSDKFVRFDEPLTEFIFTAEVANHRRIVLSAAKADVYPDTTDELYTFGLFPGGRIWSPQTPDLYNNGYHTYTGLVQFKLSLGTYLGYKIIQLDKDVGNGFENIRAFPVPDHISSFHASIWFYEVGGSLKICPPALVPGIGRVSDVLFPVSTGGNSARNYETRNRGSSRQEITVDSFCHVDDGTHIGIVPFDPLPWIRPDAGCNDSLLGCEEVDDTSSGLGFKCKFAIDSDGCGTNDAMVAVDLLCGTGVFAVSSSQSDTFVSNRGNTVEKRYPQVDVRCAFPSGETEGAGGIVQLYYGTLTNSGQCEDKFIGCECNSEGVNGSENNFYRCNSASCFWEADLDCDGGKMEVYARARCSNADIINANSGDRDEPEAILASQATQVAMVESTEYPGHISADITCRGGFGGPAVGIAHLIGSYSVDNYIRSSLFTYKGCDCKEVDMDANNPGYRGCISATCYWAVDNTINWQILAPIEIRPVCTGLAF